MCRSQYAEDSPGLSQGSAEAVSPGGRGAGSGSSSDAVLEESLPAAKRRRGSAEDDVRAVLTSKMVVFEIAPSLIVSNFIPIWKEFFFKVGFVFKFHFVIHIFYLLWQ
jgi:hypothetical protein